MIATSRNFALALLVGTLFALSPLSSGSRVTLSVAGGLLVAALAFFGRLSSRLDLEPRPPVEAEEPQAAGRVQASAGALVWVALGAFALVFVSSVPFFFDAWTRSVWQNAHGIFVPFVVAYLAYVILRRDGVREADSSAWGIPILCVGLGLVVLDSGIGSGYLSALALPISLPGLSLMLLGARRTRLLVLPLGLAFFAVPLPTAFSSVFGFAELTSVGMENLLRLLSVPVVRFGNTFSIPVGYYGVSDNCSGFSIFYAGLFLAVLFAYYTRSPARRILLLLAPWALTVLFNSLRGAALLYACNLIGGHLLSTALHGLTGMAAFWPVVVSLLLVADRRELRRALIR